jgi:SH3 domain-containing YSC84-like protein 1
MRPIALFATCFLAAGSFAADIDGVGAPAKRIQQSAAVLSEIMDAKDQSIPRDLLQKAHCVGIVPSLKRAGLVLGGKYGKGVITCRLDTSAGISDKTGLSDTAAWSAPATVRIEGGTIGAQIGFGETDVVFVVMNKKGEERLIKDKFTIGSDVSGMIGPVGRSAAAQTDALMRAEILSYSRSRGAFVGVTLDGATLRPDNGDNRKIYGVDATQAEILHGAVKPPASADELYAELNKYAAVRGK